MRICVTGATGFIGSALCARLADEGMTVIAITRRLEPGLAARCELRCVDDGQDVRAWRDALAGADAVVHLAARAHRGEALDARTRAEFQAVNVTQTQALASAAAAAGIRHVVFMSSSKVYGEVSPLSAEGSPQRFGPASPAAPQGPYGASKLRAEQVLKAACEPDGIGLTILRPPLVYGPGVKGNLHSLLGVIARGIPLPFASIRNLRSLVSRDNLVEAVVLALRAALPGTRVHTLSDLDVSTPALVRMMASAMGRDACLWPLPVPILQGLGRLTGQSAAVGRLVDSFVLDRDAIRAALGWVPQGSADTVWGAVAGHFRQARLR